MRARHRAQLTGHRRGPLASAVGRALDLERCQAPLLVLLKRPVLILCFDAVRVLDQVCCRTLSYVGEVSERRPHHDPNLLL